MPNTNCLAGMKCPSCKSLEPVTIFDATCTVTVTDDGTEDAVNFNWEDSCRCQCRACGFDGQVRDFKRQGKTKGD